MMDSFLDYAVVIARCKGYYYIQVHMATIIVQAHNQTTASWARAPIDAIKIRRQK